MKNEHEEYLDQLNTTELVALAVFNELPGFPPAGAPKGYPRKVLIEALMKLESPKIPPPMMDERVNINKFVSSRWGNFKSQAPYRQCPECSLGKIDRKVDEYVRCSDLQVSECWVKNKSHFV